MRASLCPRFAQRQLLTQRKRLVYASGPGSETGCERQSLADEAAKKKRALRFSTLEI